MDYQGNSNKQKEEATTPTKKVVEPVVTGKVVQRKKGIGQKAKAIFFGGEFKSAADFTLAERVFPAIRNMMYDAGMGILQGVIFGRSHQRPNTPSSMGSRITYNNPLQARQQVRGGVMIPDQPPYHRQINRRQANDIIFAGREDAALVLERLGDIIDQYKVASLADLYDLIGMPVAQVDHKWGWTYMNNAEIRQTRDGYLLELPPLEEI